MSEMIEIGPSFKTGARTLRGKSSDVNLQTPTKIHGPLWVWHEGARKKSQGAKVRPHIVLHHSFVYSFDPLFTSFLLLLLPQFSSFHSKIPICNHRYRNRCRYIDTYCISLFFVLNTLYQHAFKLWKVESQHESPFHRSTVTNHSNTPSSTP